MDGLARELYYTQNTFIIGPVFPSRGLRPHLIVPHRVHGEFIRKPHLEFKVHLTSRSLRSMLEALGGWRFLLRLNAVVDLQPRAKLTNVAREPYTGRDYMLRVWLPEQTAWQDDFTKLKDLRLVLKPVRVYENSNCMVHYAESPKVNADFAYEFKQRLMDTHIALRAQKVEVVVRGMDWTQHGHAHDNDRLCDQIVADVIRAKIEAPVPETACPAVEDIEMMDIDDVNSNLADLARLPNLAEDNADDAFLPIFITDQQAGIMERFRNGELCEAQQNNCECCRITWIGKY